VPKSATEMVERIVEELMSRKLTKAQRMRLLQRLVRTGEQVPEELMDLVLRRLMERQTD
jgi:hypothetical protein